MDIHPLGREEYSVKVTLSPAASGVWEASFDGGVTWLAGTDLGNGSYGWLVAGANNDDPDNLAVYRLPDPKATSVRQVSPLLRLETGQEEIVLAGPPITF